MPATCFSGLPRSAGVMAQLLPELAAALSGVACATRAFSRAQRVVRPGGLQMHAQANRTASGAGVCGPAPPRTLLASCKTLACQAGNPKQRKAGLEDQAKGTKAVHCDGTNQTTIDQSLTYC